jgi:hypothetical protein
MCGQNDDIHSSFWIIFNWITIEWINHYIGYWISIYQSVWYLQKIAASLTFLFMFILLIFLCIFLEIQICCYPFMDEQISFQFNLHNYCSSFCLFCNIKYFLTVNFEILFSRFLLELHQSLFTSIYANLHVG